MRTLKKSYRTRGGLLVHATTTDRDPAFREEIIAKLDKCLGVYLCSSFEYPGRYKRWDMGFTDPPLEIRCYGRRIRLAALNEKGLALLDFIHSCLSRTDYFEEFTREGNTVSGRIARSEEVFPEERRSRQKSVFSMIQP